MADMMEVSPEHTIVSVTVGKGPLCMKSGRFDSVHPAPYTITEPTFGLSYGFDNSLASSAHYPHRLSRRLVGLA